MRYEDENIWLTQKMMATLYDAVSYTHLDVYKRQTVNCTIHHISDKVLYQLVLRSIQRLSSRIIADERGFAEELKSKWERCV